MDDADDDVRHPLFLWLCIDVICDMAGAAGLETGAVSGQLMRHESSIYGDSIRSPIP